MKKALLTTTALVALNGVAFASSIDTPVNSAGSTHHTHSNATIVWSGDANIKYNVPLKKNAGDSTDGTRTMIEALAGAIIGVATFLQPFIIVFDAIGTVIVGVFGVVALIIGKLRPVMAPLLKILGIVGLVIATVSGVAPAIAAVVGGIALLASIIQDLMKVVNKKRSPSFKRHS